MVVPSPPAMTLTPLLHTAIAQTGDVVSDPSNQRVVDAMVWGLVVLGVAVLGVTLWFWRATRPDHHALTGLEAMSRRKFRRASGDRERREILEVEASSPVSSEVPPVERPGAPIDPLLRP